IMKSITLLAIIVTILSTPAFAQKRPYTTTPSSSSYSYTPREFSNPEGSMHVYGNLGWFGTESSALWKDTTTTGSGVTPTLSGLIGLGADFEYMLQNDLGLTGVFRYYGTGDKTG